MDFQSASHGLSVTGMQNFINDINVNVFDAVKAAIDDTTAVTDAVKQGWEGNAADNFNANIITGSKKMRETVQKVEEMLLTELEGIQSQILDMDETLVELES